MQQSKYLSYDPTVESGPNIRGQYSTKELAGVNHILVTALEIEQFRRNPNGFRVTLGKLEKINQPNLSTIQRMQSEKEITKTTITSPLEVQHNEEKFVYIPDMTLQLNTAIGLHLCIHDKKKTISLPCKVVVSDTWIFRDHTYDDLVRLATAINDRRESISSGAYETL